MHAGGSSEGGIDPDPDPDRDPDSSHEDKHGGNNEEKRCQDNVGASAVMAKEAPASPCIDGDASNVAAPDGKPLARPDLSQPSHGPVLKASSSTASTLVKRRKPKPKHQRSQKPEGYPSRNRSSYNYFFQAQRALLIQEAKAPDTGAAAAKAKTTVGDGGDLSETAASQSGTAEVGFENMAKTIAQRWKKLTPSELEPFQELARRDMARYRSEMEAYQQELVRQSRLEREKAAAHASGTHSHGITHAPAPMGGPYRPAATSNASSNMSAAGPTTSNGSSNLHQALLGGTPHSPQDQARYANLVLSHLESLLHQPPPPSQQQPQGAAMPPATAAPAPPAPAPAPAPGPSASMGDLNFLAASALSQLLVRQAPWNTGSPVPSASTSTSTTAASQLPGLWNLAGLQQQQSLQLQLQQQQQQQQQQRQLETIANAAQLALLQQLLSAPMSTVGGAAAPGIGGGGGGARRLASPDRGVPGGALGMAPTAPDPQGTEEDPPGRPSSSSPPHPPRST